MTPARKSAARAGNPQADAVRRVHNGKAKNRGPVADTPDPRESLLARSIKSAMASGVISGRLARALRHWAGLWGVPELVDRMKFRHNACLRTTIARWVIASNTLELSARFFELPDAHWEILCHELAHAAAVRLGGQSVRPHGRLWGDLVRQAGFVPRPRHVTLQGRGASVPHVRRSGIYEHRCPICHAVRVGKRRVNQWRCAECVGAGLPGHLVITCVPSHTDKK
jgi:predicted SprT family Zn-dependent metalloprotease